MYGEEEIKFSVSFDMIIVINNIKYRANISLDLPYNNITEEGITKLEIDGAENFVFKREK